jgi:hypothetical protein
MSAVGFGAAVLFVVCFDFFAMAETARQLQFQRTSAAMVKFLCPVMPVACISQPPH